MKQIISILLVCLFAGIIVMPSTVKVGSLSLYRPLIDINFLGKRFYRDLELKLGLDLQGGTRIVYETDTSKVESENVEAAVEAARNNIERRINLLGVAEAVVQTSKSGDKNRIAIELPGVKDVNQAISIIGQTAFLEFKETKVATPTSELDFESTGLTGQDLKIAKVEFNSNPQGPGQAAGAPVVSLEFTPEGAKKFAEITQRNLGKPVAILLDGQIRTAPMVQSVISDGRAVITGGFSLEEAKGLVIGLNAGALPVPIKIVEQKNIGATLGQESINQSILAGLVGLGMVCLFMIANYGLKGLIADIALVIYVLVSLAIIKLVPVTLTLAGIAGLVLSIGMAVDANILIFERIKEELRWGRSMKAALELGFHRAWNSIKDSNISSLITAGILFWFGTGMVRGFALTLAIGIGVSLFSAIFVTQALLKLVYYRK
jgi:preprotein translocase subunit SecD